MFDTLRTAKMAFRLELAGCAIDRKEQNRGDVLTKGYHEGSR